MLAITDWQSVGGYLGEIMASPGSSVMSFSACRTEPGISGYDFWLDICEFPRQYIGYWPGLRHDVRSYLASCVVCLAHKFPCPRRASMGHVDVGHRWDRVAMDFLDMSVTTAKDNRYVLVMVDCFSRWTEACQLPDKTALAVADAFFQHIVCRFGMSMVIHSDQGREFENKVIQELCLLCGSHKTRTTPYHPESDGLVERFNRTLLMMLAMFAGENRDDWDDHHRR